MVFFIEVADQPFRFHTLRFCEIDGIDHDGIEIVYPDDELIDNLRVFGMEWVSFVRHVKGKIRLIDHTLEYGAIKDLGFIRSNCLLS